MRLIYLASPYTHKDPKVRKERKDKAAETLAYFANNAENLCIYSPIVHWHGVASEHELPHSFEFWAQQDFHMIKLSTALWVLLIPGWKESYGLQQEIEFAEHISCPILYVDQLGTDFVLMDAVPSDHPTMRETR